MILQLNIHITKLKTMKIGYSKTFPVIGKDQWEKNWLEDDVILNIDYLNLTDADIEKAMLNIRKVQYALKKQVNDFFYESNKAAEKQAKEDSDTPKSQEDKIIAQIKGITDIKVLEGFLLLARKYPNVQLAYNEQQLKLK